MKFLPITTESGAWQLTQLPVVAVDLGFSGKDPTTGVAWFPPSQSGATKLRFGEAVKDVAGRIRSFGDVVLVLEAPLSYAFNNDGNPQPRGDFERKPQCRWWSVGPGAATALSALFFLRQLHRELESAKVTIHLVEGFVSGDYSGPHDKVAAKLRDGFRGKRKRQCYSVTEKESVISVLDWVTCDSPHNPPVILQPQ